MRCGERNYRSGADRREVSELSCRIMLPRRLVTLLDMAVHEYAVLFEILFAAIEQNSVPEI
jgi:hypothetical protein